MKIRRYQGGRPEKLGRSGLCAVRLSGVLACLGMTGTVSASSVPAGVSMLEPLVVTAARTPQPLTDSVTDVVLISAQMLRDSGLRSVDDALRRFAGLQLARNGGPGQSGGYFLRGVAANGIVVLMDGVRVGSASLGQADLESLDLTQIDHIEVVRGPVSGMYGADAVGGVVNLVTRRGQGAPHVHGYLALGSDRGREIESGVSGVSGNVDYAASVGREQSRGRSVIRPGDRYGYYNPDRDGFTRSMGTVKLGITPVIGHRLGLSVTETDLNAQYDSAVFDAVSGRSDASLDFRNRLKTRVMALDYTGELSRRWEGTARLSHGVDDDRSGALALDRYKTVRDEVVWENALHWAVGQQLLVGWEYRRESVSSNQYALAGTLDAIGRHRRNNQAVLAGYTGVFGRTDVQASLRYDHSSIYGKQTTGSLGVAKTLTERLKLRGMVGTSFRAPSFNDLYYPNYGVRTLRPEQGRSTELGLVWRSASTRASVTLYHNQIRDLIGYDPDSSGTTCPAGYFGCAANIAKARLKGATFQTAHDWGFLRLTAVIDFLDAKDLRTGGRLNRRAAHQSSIGVDYLADGWNAGMTLTRVGARPDGDRRLGGYADLDLRANWQLDQRWTMEMRVLNATDRDIEPVRDYQAPGRQLWLGVRLESGI